jgi:uncharacterized membrane protein YGL010W
MLGGRPRKELLAIYIADHQNPINKRFHLFGIPAVFFAVLFGLASPFVAGLWPWALVLIVIGTALQLIGHRFEGKPPSATNDWRFLLIGVGWWVRYVLGKL